MSKLINYTEVSRKLAGNTTSISKNRIPDRYIPKVDALVAKVEEWEIEQGLKK